MWSCTTDQVWSVAVHNVWTCWGYARCVIIYTYKWLLTIHDMIMWKWCGKPNIYHVIDGLMLPHGYTWCVTNVNDVTVRAYSNQPYIMLLFIVVHGCTQWVTSQWSRICIHDAIHMLQVTHCGHGCPQWVTSQWLRIYTDDAIRNSSHLLRSCLVTHDTIMSSWGTNRTRWDHAWLHKISDHIHDVNMTMGPCMITQNQWPAYMMLIWVITQNQ